MQYMTLLKTCRQQSCRLKDEGYSQGFGLVELLIALAMGSILLLALWSVHAATASSQAYRQVLTDLTQQGNLLQWMFVSRASQAGFWGYRHIDSHYQVTNGVCPALLGQNLEGVRVVNAKEGPHVQISYLDSTVFDIQALGDDSHLVLARTDAFMKDRVVGIGDLTQGWVSKIATVSQRGTSTVLGLTTALPKLQLPAVIGLFHGDDDSVSVAGRGTLGLWEQPCDARRGLIMDNIAAWQVKMHVAESQGFIQTLSAKQIPDALQLNFLLRSPKAVLTAPMRYRWLAAMQQASDNRFYLPWSVMVNMAQLSPLGSPDGP